MDSLELFQLKNKLQRKVIEIEKHLKQASICNEYGKVAHTEFNLSLTLEELCNLEVLIKELK